MTFYLPSAKSDQMKGSQHPASYEGYKAQSQDSSQSHEEGRPRVYYREGRSYYYQPRPVTVLPPPPPPPPPKYPHLGYHPGLPWHLRDEHYADPYLVWGSPGAFPVDHSGYRMPEYPLQDAWYMYPTGPWKTHWTGTVPNLEDRLLLCEAKPKPHDHRMLSSTRPNKGVATNEQAFIHPEVFGREYVPHDLAIRNVRWSTIGSMMPAHDEEEPQGWTDNKKRHLAMRITEPPGMAPAVDIKGIEERRFDYGRMNDHRQEEALYPGLAKSEHEVEVFDDEALAEFFADPEAMLEREFKVM